MFCPNCGAEFEPGFTECNECQVSLVDQPPGTTETTASVVKPLAWTVGLLALYHALRYIPLPIFDFSGLEALRDTGLFGRANILSLGIVPFISGFLLVELFSLLTPWGRSAREDGARGRRKLNRWALACSLVVCVSQAFAMLYSLEALTTPGGQSFVASPGIFTRLLGIASITAGSVAAFVLCNVITARGIGNGFCLVVAIESLNGALGTFELMKFESGSTRSGSSLLLLTLAVAAVFVVLLQRRSAFSVADADHRSMPSRLPAFPQSLLPISAAFVLLNLPASLASIQGRMPEEEALGPIGYLVGLAVVVPALSYVALHLFSSRKRIERNLPNLTPAESFDALLGRRFWLTTAVTTLAVVFLSAMEVYVYADHFLLGVAQIVLIVAVVLDLVDEWRFRRRHGDTEVLAELDNVHLAHLVEAGLAERGIGCQVKALHYRSLIFWWGPIYKMNVLVAADRLDEAREWLDELDPRIV